MKYNPIIWWENLYGPSTLVNEIQKELNNKKNIIVSCDYEIPWIEYLYEQVKLKKYDFKIDYNEISIDEISEDSTILKEILTLNGIGYQYKGDKNSIKYLDNLDLEYMKVYFLMNVPQNRVDEVTYLMKNTNNKTKVLFVAVIKNTPTQERALKVKKYNDYVTVYDKVRFLKLITQKNNELNYMNDYIAELVGRVESSLERAIDISLHYCLGKTYNFNEFNENQKKIVWESQLFVFFPLLEKKRYEFVEKFYGQIKLQLPIKDVFENIYNNPEELEIGHLMRLIKLNKISLTSSEKREFEIYYDMRNKLAHQKIVDEDILLQLFKYI